MSPSSLARLRGIAVAAIAVFGLLLIQSPDSVEGRAVAIGLNGQGTLLVVGDSLTVGTEAFGSLSKKTGALGIWTNVVVDAKVGRKASLGATVIEKGLTSSTTALVIALGTNDMISKPETWNTQACIVEDSVAPGSTHTTHNKHMTSTSLSHTIAPPKTRVSISIHDHILENILRFLTYIS